MKTEKWYEEPYCLFDHIHDENLKNWFINFIKTNNIKRPLWIQQMWEKNTIIYVWGNRNENYIIKIALTMVKDHIRDDEGIAISDDEYNSMEDLYACNVWFIKEPAGFVEEGREKDLLCGAPCYQGGLYPNQLEFEKHCENLAFPVDNKTLLNYVENYLLICGRNKETV